MLAILAFITPIALFDMLSTLPVNSVILLSQMRGNRPTVKALMYVGGFYSASVLGGLLVAFGLQWVFDLIVAALREVIVSRTALIFGLQFVFGLAMIVASERLQLRTKPKILADKDSDPKASNRDAKSREPGRLRSFSLGFGMSAAGLPSGFTYFVAIDQMMKLDAGLLPIVLLLVYYNLIVVAPMLVLTYIALRVPGQGQQIVERIGQVSGQWAPRVVRTALITIGAIMAVDALIFFSYGLPLIPLPS